MTDLLTWQAPDVEDHTARHQRGVVVLPRDLGSDQPAGTLVPAWVCCDPACGGVEMSAFVLNVNHHCCNEWRPDPFDRRRRCGDGRRGRLVGAAEVPLMGNRPVDYTDYDEVAVQRLMDGQHLWAPIPAAEAAEVVRRLARAGYDDGQIALRLGFRRRSVLRIRQRLEIPPGLPLGGNHFTRRVAAPARARSAG